MAKLDNLNETPYVNILTLDELDLKKKKGVCINGSMIGRVDLSG